MPKTIKNQALKGRTLIRVLLDQKNPDGSLKTKKLSNGVKVEMVGGVVEDNIGNILGYVYDESKYIDNNYVRKPETMAKFDWLEGGKDFGTK